MVQHSYFVHLQMNCEARRDIAKDKSFDYESEGRAFESLRDHH